MSNTERKGFNFYRSYYDVYLELPDEDKLKFMNALLQRQFYGVEPIGLSGQAKFAYIGQKHSINAQVKGFEDKTNTTLHPPAIGGSPLPAEPPTEPPPTEPPSVQEEGKEKEEVEYTISDFEIFWGAYHKITNLKKTDVASAEKFWNKLKEAEKKLALDNIQNYFDSIEDKQYLKKCRTYLSAKSFNDEFAKATENNQDNEYQTPTINPHTGEPYVN